MYTANQGFPVLKQVHPDTGISNRAMSILNSFVNGIQLHVWCFVENLLTCGQIFLSGLRPRHPSLRHTTKSQPSHLAKSKPR